MFDILFSSNLAAAHGKFPAAASTTNDTALISGHLPLGIESDQIDAILSPDPLQILPDLVTKSGH